MPLASHFSTLYLTRSTLSTPCLTRSLSTPCFLLSHSPNLAAYSIHITLHYILSSKHGFTRYYSRNSHNLTLSTSCLTPPLTAPLRSPSSLPHAALAPHARAPLPSPPSHTAPPSPQLAPDSIDDESLPGEVANLGLDKKASSPACDEEPIVGALEDDSLAPDATDETVAAENQTLLYSIPKGWKHLIAVRVAKELTAPEPTGPGWSPAFSLLSGLGLTASSRSFRAGGYDLGVNISAVETAARGRTKVVSFVQRFWLSNQLKLAIECEQWAPPPARLEQPLMPLAAGERAPFHWPHAKEVDRLLRIRPVPGQGMLGYVPTLEQGWSAGFPIDAAGRFVVHSTQGESFVVSR